MGLLSLSEELCLAALRPLLKEKLGGAVLIDLDVAVALPAQTETPGKGLKVSNKTNPAHNNTDEPMKLSFLKVYEDCLSNSNESSEDIGTHTL